MRQIAARGHLVVILAPGSPGRYAEPGIRLLVVRLPDARQGFDAPAPLLGRRTQFWLAGPFPSPARDGGYLVALAANVTEQGVIMW